MDYMAHPEEALHWGSQVFPSKSDFDMMVRSYLEHNMGIKLHKDADIMETLWFPDKTAPSSAGIVLPFEYVIKAFNFQPKIVKF